MTKINLLLKFSFEGDNQCSKFEYIAFRKINDLEFNVAFFSDALNTHVNATPFWSDFF